MAKRARKAVKRAVRRAKPAKRVMRKVARKAAVSKKAVRRAKPMKARKPARAAPVRIMPLKGRANLIVTFDPNHRGTAELEIAEVLKQIGEKPQLGQTEIEGLFKAAVSDARKAIAKIRNLCTKNPNIFSVTHHYTPIDKWCPSEIPAMQKAIKEASEGIGTSEKWKMGLNKRHWDKLEGVQLIMKLTSVVDRKKVDLDNPEKIIQVEIIGKEAGIALLSPNELFDAEREKAE